MSIQAIFAAQDRVPLLCFTYRNWRGDVHDYVIEPESIEFGHYHGDINGEREGMDWLLHGFVVKRDGDPRADLGTDKGNRRRTFLVNDIDMIKREEASDDRGR